jgi:ferredoxin
MAATRPTRHGIQVSIDWGRCNGLGICLALAPQAFLFDHDDEVATVHDPEAADRQTLLDVARSCPRQAIFLDEADGLALYP